MDRPSPRRDARTGAHFEPPAQNRRNTAKPPAPEQVREVGGLYRLSPGAAGQASHRVGGGERPRRAHPESLSNREFVSKSDLDRSGKPPRHAAGDLLGDRPRSPLVPGDAHTGPRTGTVHRLSPDAQFQDDARADRAPAPRVSVTKVRAKDPRDMAGRERDGDPGSRLGHRPRVAVLVVRTYK